jgi:hypothetical protein
MTEKNLIDTETIIHMFEIAKTANEIVVVKSDKYLEDIKELAKEIDVSAISDREFQNLKGQNIVFVTFLQYFPDGTLLYSINKKDFQFLNDLTNDVLEEGDYIEVFK